MEITKYRIAVVILLVYAWYCVHQLKSRMEGFSANLIGSRVIEFNNFVHNLENNRITGNFRIQGRLDAIGQAMINKGYVFFTKKPERGEINDVISDAQNRIKPNNSVIMNGYNQADQILWTGVKSGSKKMGI